MDPQMHTSLCQGWQGRDRLRFLVALWVLFPIALGLFIWWFGSHGARNQLGGTLLVTFIYFGIFATIFGVSMPRLGPRVFSLSNPWNWVVFVALVVALATLGAVIVGIILVAAKFLPSSYYWGRFANEALFDSGISLVVAYIFAQYHRMHFVIEEKELALRTQELEKERALKLASEAQLASLESRIHPHFLFNTLNSISALTQEDPAKAEQLIQRLSALLRFSLDANAHGLVPLGEEIKIVRDYLEIERARFGTRLACTFRVPPEIESLKAPPLAVQTLVENSVKHAIAPRREGGEIRVEAKTSGEQLLLEVWDNGPGFNLSATPNGHGLDNLAARLASLFGGSAGLRVDRRDGGTAVTVTLPKIYNGVASKH
ncbi:MAG: sensor histidine kinase [Terriglobia bacterium]